MYICFVSTSLTNSIFNNFIEAILLCNENNIRMLIASSSAAEGSSSQLQQKHVKSQHQQLRGKRCGRQKYYCYSCVEGAV